MLVHATLYVQVQSNVSTDKWPSSSLVLCSCSMSAVVSARSATGGDVAYVNLACLPVHRKMSPCKELRHTSPVTVYTQTLHVAHVICGTCFL